MNPIPSEPVQEQPIRRSQTLTLEISSAQYRRLFGAVSAHPEHRQKRLDEITNRRAAQKTLLKRIGYSLLCIAAVLFAVATFVLVKEPATRSAYFWSLLWLGAGVLWAYYEVDLS